MIDIFLSSIFHLQSTIFYALSSIVQLIVLSEISVERKG